MIFGTRNSVTTPALRLLPLVALLPCCSAHAQAPTDIVSRNDIAYDLLGSLAAKGRIPGYTLRDFARGDRLYTRSEIAHILSLNRPDADGRYAVSERILREQFAPELNRIDSERFALDPRIAAHVGEASGWVNARIVTNPAEFSGIGRFSGAVPFGRDGFAILSGGNLRDAWYSGHDLLTHPGKYGPIENAYVHVNGRSMNVTLGQMPVRWGPGYSGALLIGDIGPSMPQIKLDKTFLLPGTLGRHVGRIRFEDFAGAFFESDVPGALPGATGTRRYLSGRSLIFGGGPWNFTVAEAMKSTRLPNPEMSLLIPLFFYQNDGTAGSKRYYFPFLITKREPNTYWKNYQGDASISYTADRRSGLNVFADVLIDDVKALHGLGNGFNTPQKLGEQFGISAPRIGGENGRFGARVEYTSVDPDTYTNASPTETWNINSAPLGYPSGPNARVLFARMDATVTDKIKFAVDGETRRAKGTPLPGYSAIRSDRVGIYGSYAFAANAFAGLRLSHGSLDTIDRTIGAAGGNIHRTRVEANVAFGL